MTGASTLVGDSLGAAVWALTTATSVAAPMAPPTRMVAILVRIPESKVPPLGRGHANSQRRGTARLRHRSTGGSSSATVRKAAHAAPRATYQVVGGVRTSTSPLVAIAVRSAP